MKEVLFTQMANSSEQAEIYFKVILQTLLLQKNECSEMMVIAFKTGVLDRGECTLAYPSLLFLVSSPLAPAFFPWLLGYAPA